jgi:hypothetical protein
MDRRLWLSLFRLGVLIVLICGFVGATAQLVPSVPAAQKAAQQSSDEDLGVVVDRMVKGQQAAADTYARTESAAQKRLDQLRAAWQRAASAVRDLSWLQRITGVLTLLATLFALRLAPLGVRLLRRRVLDSV